MTIEQTHWSFCKNLISITTLFVIMIVMLFFLTILPETMGLFFNNDHVISGIIQNRVRQTSKTNHFKSVLGLLNADLEQNFGQVILQSKMGTKNITGSTNLGGLWKYKKIADATACRHQVVMICVQSVTVYHSSKSIIYTVHIFDHHRHVSLGLLER